MAEPENNNGDKANTSSKISEVEVKHRGVIDGEGKVVAPCSEDYLVSLVLEILRARAYPLVKLVRTHDMPAQVRRLQFISTEVRRLIRSPALFPSLSVRARFSALLASDANLQFAQSVKELLLHDVVGELDQFERDNFTRPTYQKDSKGWENFYLNMAPGAPTKQPILKTTPLSSYQSVPIVGMRIIGDFCREDRLLRQWVRETTVPVDVKPAATTRLLNLDKPDEQEPNPKHMLRQESEDVSIRPNPFGEDRKLRLGLPNHGPEPLEDFTPFLGRLEAPPLPQNVQPATLNNPEVKSRTRISSYAAIANAFMDSLIDWDGIRDDAAILRASTEEDIAEAAGAEQGDSVVAFDNDGEAVKFQQELERVLWMLA